MTNKSDVTLSVPEFFLTIDDTHLFEFMNLLGRKLNPKTLMKYQEKVRKKISFFSYIVYTTIRDQSDHAGEFDNGPFQASQIEMRLSRKILLIIICLKVYQKRSIYFKDLNFDANQAQEK